MERRGVKFNLLSKLEKGGMRGNELVEGVLKEWESIVNPRHACAARVTVVVPCVCVCVCVFPRPSSATRATKRQTRHTGGLSIVFASV